jgi:hypothetical protein
MTDRVYAFVQAVEASAPQSDFDRLSAHSKRQQLPACHHPVLAVGQACNPHVQVTSLP